MHNREMPLPSPEEVFICNSSTSAEEVNESCVSILFLAVTVKKNSSLL